MGDTPALARSFLFKWRHLSFDKLLFGVNMKQAVSTSKAQCKTKSIDYKIEIIIRIQGWIMAKGFKL